MKVSIIASFLLAASTLPITPSASAQSASQVWLGQSPFCEAKTQDCASKGMSFARTHISGDGDTCLTGIKVLCVGEPVPGSSVAPGTSSGPVGKCPMTAAQLTSQLRCECTPELTGHGAIYGSETYTADSRICRAAVHAGVIPASGGVVNVSPKPGQAAYRGSTANGVTSYTWRSYPNSFTVSQ